jgi:serine/threonine protein kinase
MEICEKGDLSQKLFKCKSLSLRIHEKFIWQTMVDVAGGLAFLHQNNISHRDLKPANIFIAANGSVKLGDLNVSKLIKEDDLMQSQAGTPYYMAPEVWGSSNYDDACDIWSLGTVIYEMAALKLPFQKRTLIELKHIVKSGRFSPIPSMYSLGLSQIIHRMLVVDPKNRIKAVDILNHDEVILRKENNELSESNETASEMMLLATMKPPKSRREYNLLSENLSTINAQVITARRRSIAATTSSTYSLAPLYIPSPRIEYSEDNEQQLPLNEAVDNKPSSAPSLPPLIVKKTIARNAPRLFVEPVEAAQSPLPEGWKIVPSRSRPGKFTYLNVSTGERETIRPTQPAAVGGPLPPGWKQVPSKTKPGVFAFVNEATGERIGWRPTTENGSRP